MHSSSMLHVYVLVITKFWQAFGKTEYYRAYMNFTHGCNTELNTQKSAA